MIKPIIRIFLLLVILVPIKLFAGDFISHNSLSLTVNGFGANGLLVDTNGIGSSDQVNSLGFWFRVDGGSQEYPITSSAPVSTNTILSTVVYGYEDVGDLGLFDAKVSVDINDNGGFGLGLISYAVELIPLKDNPPTVDVFIYGDPDLNGTSGNDSAFLFSPSGENGMIVIDDICLVMAAQFWDREFGFGLSDTYQAEIPDVIPDALNDGSLTDLDNSGLPLGPGNFSGAHQFLDRDPTEEVWFGVMGFLDADSNPEFCSEPVDIETVPVPGPGRIPLAILIMLMLAGAWHFRARIV